MVAAVVLALLALVVAAAVGAFLVRVAWQAYGDRERLDRAEDSIRELQGADSGLRGEISGLASADRRMQAQLRGVDALAGEVQDVQQAHDALVDEVAGLERRQGSLAAGVDSARAQLSSRVSTGAVSIAGAGSTAATLSGAAPAQEALRPREGFVDAPAPAPEPARWLHVTDATGARYLPGGVAAANVWARDSLAVQGARATYYDSGPDAFGKLMLVHDGSYTQGGLATGSLIGERGLAVRGGASRLNPGGWATWLPHQQDGRNYLRGDTEVLGDAAVAGRLLLGSNAAAPQVALERDAGAADASGGGASGGGASSAGVRVTLGGAGGALSVFGGAPASATAPPTASHRFAADGSVVHAGAVAAPSLRMGALRLAPVPPPAAGAAAAPAALGLYDGSSAAPGSAPASADPPHRFALDGSAVHSGFVRAQGVRMDAVSLAGARSTLDSSAVMMVRSSDAGGPPADIAARRVYAAEGVAAAPGGAPPLVERSFGASGSRFGLANVGNATHVYAGNDQGGEAPSANLSLATGDGTFRAVLSAEKNVAAAATGGFPGGRVKVIGGPLMVCNSAGAACAELRNVNGALQLCNSGADCRPLAVQAP